MKKQVFPTLFKMHNDKIYGYLFQIIGAVILGGNLVFATSWNGDVAEAPPTQLFNALYYSISRVSWILATFLVFLSVFLKRF